MSDQQIKIMVLSDEIINLVNEYRDSQDDPDGLTNSDMQGVAEAIAIKALA